MTSFEVSSFLYEKFPDIKIDKVLQNSNEHMAIYFKGFDGELNSSIRKSIILNLKTQLGKKFPRIHFHVAHVTYGLI